MSFEQEIIPDGDGQNVITALIAGILSAIFFALGIGYLFYLAPLQYVISRRGSKAFLIAVGTSFVLGLGAIFIRQPGPDIWISGAGALGYLLALACLNLGTLVPALSFSLWQRLGAGILLSAVGTAIVLAVLHVRKDGADFLELIRESGELSDFLLTMLPGMTLDEIFEFIRNIMYRSIALSSGIMLSLSYVLGRVMALGTKSLISLIERYHLPPDFIWTIIGFAVLVLAGEYFDIKSLAHMAWNGFLTALLLYFYKGVSLLWFIMKSKPALKAALPPLLVISIFIPGLNLAVPLVITVMGISSLWVRYSNGTAVGGSAGSER